MDTITAIATPNGIGALAIIRISGENAFEITEKIVKFKKKIKNGDKRKVIKNYIIGKDKRIIDEVIIILYKSPKSYTGEDCVEIISHGGIYTVKNIIKQIIQNGARIAERGEFTRRAFNNGKIDLNKAEAINALIESKNEEEYFNAINSYEGAAKKINEWEEKIKKEIMYIEANIEFGEVEKIRNRDKKEINKIKNEIISEIERSKEIKNIKNNFKIIIIGPPNAGKSSLFNYLIGFERVIVSKEPGTTRDIINERIEINGKEVEIIDTAGIRETKNIIEKEGIKKTRSIIEEAKIVIWITDGSEEINEREIETIKKLKKEKTIIIINKTDKKENKEKREKIRELLYENIKISIKKGSNIKNMINKIEKKIEKNKERENIFGFIINERQNQIIKNMSEDVESAIKNWENTEIASYYLNNSLKKIEEMTGKSNNEEILNKIFNNFCIGK